MKYVCTVCGFIYDEAAGDPDNGVAPRHRLGRRARRLRLPPVRRGQGHVRAGVTQRRKGRPRAHCLSSAPGACGLLYEQVRKTCFGNFKEKGKKLLTNPHPLVIILFAADNRRQCPGVAQFGSALEWGSRGREFDSRHSDQIPQPKGWGIFLLLERVCGRTCTITGMYLRPQDTHFQGPFSPGVMNA